MRYSYLKYAVAVAGLLLIFFVESCGHKETGPRRTGNSSLSFKTALGIRYIEVRREFENGYSFNDMGFQQKPEWDLYFLPGDSVKIFSPFEHRYIHYPIYFDHESVFNTAREWFRLKEINNDSMILQLLQVKDKKVLKERSNIYMRFYSEQYLKKAGINADKMRLPDRADSIFIRKLCARANSDPDNIDSSFAATSPVVFDSGHPDIRVERIKPKKGPLDDFKASDVYMHPAYDILINNAYKDFFYNFNVLVDGKGTIRFAELLTYAEDTEGRKKVLEAIIKLYLQRMLKVEPGTTLGYPHTSLLELKVKGVKQG